MNQRHPNDTADPSPTSRVFSVSARQHGSTTSSISRNEQRSVGCTLREDLFVEVGKLAREGRFDYLLIESTGISEPMPVATTFTLPMDAAKQIALRLIRLQYAFRRMRPRLLCHYAVRYRISWLRIWPEAKYWLRTATTCRSATRPSAWNASANRATK